MFDNSRGWCSNSSPFVRGVVGGGGAVHIHGVVGGGRAILSGSFSSSYINVGLREARARPQNLLGDKPLLTAVKRHPRWFPHCAHSAMVHAYLHKRKNEKINK